MFTKTNLVIFTVLFFSITIQGKSFAEESFPKVNLDKEPRQITATIENYNIAGGEGIAMTALRLERYVRTYITAGPELDWAIVGKRGGYFAGGININFYFLNKESIKIANRIFFGGGGGGAMNLYAGGGMIIKFSGELIKPVTKKLSLRTEFGLIRFVNGRISSKLISGGISYKYYKIKEKNNIIN
jgi:hypothetical protein